jgi:hypothetical protein
MAKDSQQLEWRQVLKKSLRDLWQRISSEEVGSGRAKRKRALIFIQLPTEEEFPEYHQIIATPMDLNRIYARIEIDWLAETHALPRARKPSRSCAACFAPKMTAGSDAASRPCCLAGMRASIR